jgi:AcrR family transcriptional regulator
MSDSAGHAATPTPTLTQKPTPILSSRDRILQSAKQLFARNGYENTSTVAIAREAGTSESQLMKHFGSKQGLLIAIFDRGWDCIGDRVQATSNRKSPSEQLLAVLEAMVLELENDTDLKELISLESRRVRKDSRDVLMSRGFQQFAEVIDGLLTEMRNQGQIRDDVNLDAVRAAFVGMTEGLLRDLVVAKRSEFRADYNFDDVRQLLKVIVPALAVNGAQPLRAIKH